MNMRRMMPGFGVVLAGLGLMAWTSMAVAQNTLGAADVDGEAGQTAAVAITIDTGSSNVAFFAATFSVVAQGGAPAITTALDYAAAEGVPSPDLKTAVAAQGRIAVGYAGVTIDPPLSGMVQVGTLMVPIPDGATGSYSVELSNISAGDSDGNRVTLTAQNGSIMLAGPTGPSLAAADVEGSAGATNNVPITINTGDSNVAFFAVTFSVVAQGDAPAITTALDYAAADGVPQPDLKTAVAAQGRLAIGYAGVTIDPPLSGTVEVGTLMVPVPDGATGSYSVELSNISAGDADGNRVTLTGQNGNIALGVGPTATPTTVAPTETPTTVPPTMTPTTVPPTSTATRTNTPVPTQTSPPAPAEEDDGGCQIGANGSASLGWIMFLPVLGLLIARRRRR